MKLILALLLATIVGSACAGSFTFASTRTLQVLTWTGVLDCGAASGALPNTFTTPATICLGKDLWVAEYSDFVLRQYVNCKANFAQCSTATLCGNDGVNATASNGACVTDGFDSYKIYANWTGYTTPTADELNIVTHMNATGCNAGTQVSALFATQLCLDDNTTVAQCENGELRYYTCTASCYAGFSGINATTCVPSLNALDNLLAPNGYCAANVTNGYSTVMSCGGYATIGTATNMVTLNAWAPFDNCTGTQALTDQTFNAFCNGGYLFQCEARGLATYKCASCDNLVDACIDMTGSYGGAVAETCQAASLPGAGSGSAIFDCNYVAPVPSAAGVVPSPPAPNVQPSPQPNTPQPGTPSPQPTSATALLASVALLALAFAL